MNKGLFLALGAIVYAASIATLLATVVTRKPNNRRTNELNRIASCLAMLATILFLLAATQ